MSGITIPSNNLFIPYQLGNLSVVHKEEEFFVTDKDNLERKVNRIYLSKELRGINGEDLSKYLDLAYLSLNKVGDDYSIRLNFRLLGGGPITGAIGYWVTKTLCYGTAVAGAGVVVVATGGAAGALTGAAAAAATSGATVGASVVGGAIAGAGLTTEAALASAAVVTSAGGAAGAIALVESTSTAVGLILGSIPFLP